MSLRQLERKRRLKNYKRKELKKLLTGMKNYPNDLRSRDNIIADLRHQLQVKQAEVTAIFKENQQLQNSLHKLKETHNEKSK